jgi:hypothetical protein
LLDCTVLTRCEPHRWIVGAYAKPRRAKAGTLLAKERVAKPEAVVKRVCLLVMCLGVSVHAQAQAIRTNDNPSSFHDDAAIGATVRETPTTTFKAGVDLVALNVVVTDSAEKFVLGLARLISPSSRMAFSRTCRFSAPRMSRSTLRFFSIRRRV